MSVVKAVAEHLGVSQSTVSLVLNHRPGISDATRQRVFSAMEELGFSDYTPRAAASLKKSIQLALYKKHGRVLDDSPFFTHLLEGAEAQARRRGFHLMLTYLNEAGDIAEQLKTVLNAGCHGLILLATEMQYDDLAPFREARVPVLLLDSYMENYPADSVIINNMQGAFLATKHLCQAGHTAVGYLASKIRINNFVERRDGYLKALATFGRSYEPGFTVPLASTMEGAYQDMRAYLAGGKPLPTAFFCDNDMIAIGAMKALREAGHPIPQEISIIGFDNLTTAEITDPPLTTIHVPKAEIGRLAVERLATIMEEPTNIHVKIEVATQLVERGSVAPLARK